MKDLPGQAGGDGRRSLVEVDIWRWVKRSKIGRLCLMSFSAFSVCFMCFFSQYVFFDFSGCFNGFNMFQCFENPF